MIIRKIKQLTPEDAQIIREKSQKLNDLRERFELSPYFYNDFQKREAIKIEKNNWFIPPTRIKEMGALTLPKFVPELSLFGTFFYQKKAKKLPRYTSALSLGIYTGLMKNALKFGKVNVDFILGNSINLGSEDHVFRIGTLEDKAQKNVQDIINFFYNKKTLYNKFLKMLLENKTELKNAIGATCYEDFLALFSANLKLKTIPAFKIPKENKKKLLIIHEKSYEDIKKMAKTYRHLL